MQLTNTVPNVPISKFKRTKIIATVGPSSNSYESVLELIKSGANGIRLNFSHGNYEEREEQIKWIRKAEKEYGKPVAIIQDLQGPKIRLGDFDGIINVQTGQSLTFQYNADYERSKHIPTQYDLSKKVKRGERLYLYDGKVRTTVTSVKDGIVHARAENDGILIKRKGINLPDTDFEGDIITIKDKKDIAFGSTHDMDYVALSFVQYAEDIRNLRTMLRNLGSNAKIIAKVETKAAVDNIEEIVREADAVMVARGDLAIETEPESVPIVQRKIVGLGLKYVRPTIVATQMLASMTEMPEPTRAEVSDVATAVLIGADAVMLSDETANGQYPIEAVKVMKRVVMYTQSNAPYTVSYPEHDSDHTKHGAISDAVMTLADSLGAVAIVAETKSGATALQLSARRPARPIIAVTSDVRVAQQMAIVYGTKSYVRPDDKLAAFKLTDWLSHNKVLAKGDMIVTATGQYPGVVGTTDTIKVRVIE
ncbi:MAG: pyk, Pyruvate kinase [Candidatus Saccharibacteria bacterium]|nr:pyk, Pyruvate kinase [Candidatus Saccharibacteria bacterium]